MYTTLVQEQYHPKAERNGARCYADLDFIFCSVANHI